MGVIRLFDGTEVLVDEEDIPRLLCLSPSWSLKTSNKKYTRYAGTTLKGKSVIMHRAILGLEAGDRRVVDHINGDGLDNRRCNLRVLEHVQNMWNMPNPAANNTSGYRGVGFHKRSGRWRARISVYGKQYNLGPFSTPEEASEAYEIAKKELHRI